MTPRDDPGRRSRLQPQWQCGDAAPPERLGLLFADLHNHSLFSDGRGDPNDAFRQLREAGLDVAALTDHASTPVDRLPHLSLADYPHPHALAIARFVPDSIDHIAWKRTAELADEHDVPGRFTALRGFEWTEPWLGHVNVWFSSDFHPVLTPGRMAGVHTFLAEDEPEALFGYNHPGREPGRLGAFEVPRTQPDLTRRMVALEAFNRTHDFLFEGYDRGDRSPIADCLDAGWQPGLIGCSDEHGSHYGLVGKGRTGLWAPEHTRAGVRAALQSRRVYATREVGLRLDATLDDAPMGARLRTGSRATLAVDLAGGSYLPPEVELQLLTGSHRDRDDGGIHVVHRAGMRLGMQLGEVCRLEVPVPDDARWLILRVADPGKRRGGPAPVDHPARGWALAYSSPWYLS